MSELLEEMMQAEIDKLRKEKEALIEELRKIGELCRPYTPVDYPDED